MGRRSLLNTSLLTGLLLIAGANPAKAEEFSCDIPRTDLAQIRFAGTLSCEDQKLLAADLARLHDFVPQYPSPEAFSTLGSLDLSGHILEQWLSERVATIDVRQGDERPAEGQALLEPRLLDRAQGGRPGDSLRRLGSLFHEALHTDSESAGHQHCAAAGDYAGHAVCDAAESAAYRVEGLMLRELLKSCADCTIEDRESLRLEIADRLLRAGNE